MLNRIYYDMIRGIHPDISEDEVSNKLNSEFQQWFMLYAQQTNNVDNVFVRNLARGPNKSISTYDGYVINGYKFHVETLSSRRKTMNCGVCIKGTHYGEDELDYYGKLKEVVELKYLGIENKIILFKCDWFDPTPGAGTRVVEKYKLVEVNHRRRLSNYEPFVLAGQAVQVCYCPYPSVSRKSEDWWSVTKIKPRKIIEVEYVDQDSTTVDEPPPFQEVEIETHVIEFEPEPEEEVEAQEDDSVIVYSEVDVDIEGSEDESEFMSESDTTSSADLEVDSD